MSLNPRMADWQGRTVWLVGASSGIGLALAGQLHAAGAQVIVSARQAEALQAFVRAHTGALALPLDVTDREAVQQAGHGAVAAALQGRLDLVVYCAGFYRAQRAQSFDLDVVLRHHQVNVQGCLHVLAVVLPLLTAQRSGHLSLIASVAGYGGLPQSLAYGPTKAALLNLAETLYLDLHPLGVGVSVINPGFVQTPLTDRNPFPMPALQTPEQAGRAILDGWAAGRFEIHFPKRFTLWLKLLRHLPYRWYFTLVRRITGG
jgi:NAD(P)-dependent dehydrogenase (short-subunit alcohol dehydrogenase family)